MTGYDYSRAKATADRLINRFGKANKAVLLEPAGQIGKSFDPIALAPTEHLCRVVALEYRAREVDGTTILSTDKRFYVAVEDLQITPKTSWVLVVDGVKYRIMDVNTLQPGDVVIMWDLQCRT